jgi:predicted N-acetyltransferase YhbS
LLAALRNSHTVATARLDGVLVGLGNAISDGHLVVYFPHLLVHPAHQRHGIGRRLMGALLDRYRGFHQMMLVADGDAVEFYHRMGFERAGKTTSMWIYAGADH